MSDPQDNPETVHDISDVGDDFAGMPTDPEGIARLMDERNALAAERDALAAERDRLLRHCADFQNQMLRARKDVDESRRQAVTAVSRDVIAALDHFDVALTQDLSSATPQSLQDGMKVIRAELIRAMSLHGVGVIEPAPGDEFNPERHEAVMRQPATESVKPGHILALFQVGYQLHDRVIRPAKVVVADAPAAP
ncbi:MAG: nucleotide exchange factor GrpE [Phycisphaeraceae bacterium]|nr:nucleotide exchange factor GrpE [Phycisphaeraceae bacterium]MCW5754438.1 nucleotide exchange factor GrpE [Phycisphaeraceae bacterium]